MKQILQFKPKFDKRLEKVLMQRVSAVGRLLEDEYLERLLEQSKVVGLGGGKRFRPFLAQLSYVTFGGKSKKDILNMGVAIELLHLFCLIHDDIIDKGAKRHGEYTVHEFALNSLKKKQVNLDDKHISQSQAMLVGDLIFSFAIAEAERASYKKENGTLATGAFYEMINHVLAGEMLDVHMAGMKNSTKAELDRRNRLKTADYSFSGPIKIAARLALSSKKMDNFANNFGGLLGTAYQIQDDLLDLNSDSGKSLMSDVLTGQQTHLTYFINNLAGKNFKKQWQEITQDFTTKKVKELKDLYRISGAVEFANLETTKYFRRAREVLKKEVVPKRYLPQWVELVDLIERRKK